MARPVQILLFLCLAVRLCGSNEICSRSKGCTCMWINDLQKSRRLPVHGDLTAWNFGHAYCYRGYEEFTLVGFLHQWHELAVTITGHPSDGISVTVGNSSKAVTDHDAKICTSYNKGSGKIRLPSFRVSCVGVRLSGMDDHPVYTLNAEEKLAWRYIVSLVVGLGLLFGASSLCRNVYLYYGTGVSVGILASVVILLYVFSKFVPKKNMLGLGFLLTGYTAFASFFYWLFAYARETLLAHWEYVVGYVFVAGLISFAVMYWMGPASSRTLDIIQWTVQLIGLILVFYASPLLYVSVTAVGVSLLVYIIPSGYNPVLGILSLPFSLLGWFLSSFGLCVSCLNPFNWFWKKPRLRLLTTEEYEEQGRVETAKALRDLRVYCRSRGDEMWETVSQMSSPRRFTEFLAGRDHVSPAERVDHEWNMVDDGESDSDTVDYTEEGGTPSPHRSSFESSSSRSPPSPSTDHYSPERPSYYSPRSPSKDNHYTPLSAHRRRH